MTYSYEYNIIKTVKGQELNGKIGGKDMVQEMGMTDKQFNGFVRFLLDALKDAMEEKEESKKEEKLEKIADNLQKTLED